MSKINTLSLQIIIIEVKVKKIQIFFDQKGKNMKKHREKHMTTDIKDILIHLA